MSRLSCCSEASADETELRVIHQKPEPSAANLKLCYRGNAGNELPLHVIPPPTQVDKYLSASPCTQTHTRTLIWGRIPLMMCRAATLQRAPQEEHYYANLFVFPTKHKVVALK